MRSMSKSVVAILAVGIVFGSSPSNLQADIGWGDDLDGDGIPDFLDWDMDGDGIPNFIDSNPTLNYFDFDGDVIPNSDGGGGPSIELDDLKRDFEVMKSMNETL